MTVPYIQKMLTWWSPTITIPPAPPGNGFLWASGVLINPKVPSLLPFVFPTWMPKQFYVTFCRTTHQAVQQAGGQFAVIVDPGGAYFKSSKPPAYQDGDHSQIITLSSIRFQPGEPYERNMSWDPPVFFDQTVDVLRVQVGLFATDQAAFQIGFMAANSGPEPT